ncbi:MAG: RagB/SusD family nutrient uptake outer membrane protein [Dysgonamonadaceae bacterium]|jgi:hypothetical protein|nr:RagB/SusD family nutrient uptake outer membrane protein [Dysgonamonadaceae bacterium]
MNNKFFKYIIRNTGMICVALIAFASCNNLDLAPIDKYTDGNYWTSPEKASSILSMAYSQILSSSYYFANERLSDNLYEGRGASDEKLITMGQADAALKRFENEWADCFAGIRTCHTLLENIDNVTDMDENLKTRMKAEARFIRAFLFFRLTTWYGDVPLFTRNLTMPESNEVSRTPHAEVVSFVRNELNEIVTILPTKQQYAEDDKGRITQGAAAMLLARTYLYENDYSQVASICEKIIKGDYGQYELFESYKNLFLPDYEYNKEIILDLGYAPNLRTWSDYYDAIPISVGGRIHGFAPTQELVDDYVMKNGKGIKEAGSEYDENDPYVNRDPRFAVTIVYNEYKWEKSDGTVVTIYTKPETSTTDAEKLDEYAGPGQNSSSTGYYLRKYFDPTAPQGMASGLNLILMRYADVLLMYAEAKNELGQMNETVWNETVKPIRARAGFTDPQALNYPGLSDMQNIIRRERRCELAMEGLRIFDIRRWKTIETVQNTNLHGAKFGDLSIDNGYIRLDIRSFNKNRDYLFAVPLSQRGIDKNLTQNPGY